MKPCSGCGDDIPESVLALTVRDVARPETQRFRSAVCSVCPNNNAGRCGDCCPISERVALKNSVCPRGLFGKEQP